MLVSLIESVAGFGLVMLIGKSTVKWQSFGTKIGVTECGFMRRSECVIIGYFTERVEPQIAIRRHQFRKFIVRNLAKILNNNAVGTRRKNHHSFFTFQGTQVFKLLRNRPRQKIYADATFYIERKRRSFAPNNSIDLRDAASVVYVERPIRCGKYISAQLALAGKVAFDQDGNRPASQYPRAERMPKLRRSGFDPFPCARTEPVQPSAIPV